MSQPVSIAVLKATANDLTKDYSDETLNLILSQARDIAEMDGFPDTVTINGRVKQVLDMATKDMALHLLSAINSGTAKGVISERVDVLEKHYADVSNHGWLGTSIWGKHYLWLYSRFGAGSSSRIAVIQH